MLAHRRGEQIDVAYVALDERESGICQMALDVPAPARGEAVVRSDARDVGSREQRVGEVAADEAGAADHDI